MSLHGFCLRSFNSTTNNVQSRVTKTYCKVSAIPSQIKKNTLVVNTLLWKICCSLVLNQLLLTLVFVPAGITPRKSFIINSLWCYNWACRAGTGGMFLTLITSKDYLAGWACRYQSILIGYAKFCVSILRILSWYITPFYSYCISYKNPALAWGLFKFVNVI